MMCLVADRIRSTTSLEDVDDDVDDGVPLQAKTLDELMSNIENVMKRIHISDRETILQQLSNSFQLSKSTDAIDESAFLFLRQAYLLCQVFSSEHTEKIPTTLSQLCESFELCLPKNVFLSDPRASRKYSNLLIRWRDHSWTVLSKPIIRNFKLCKFIDLPETYSPLYLKLCQGKKCPNCNSVPKRPTICLLCGKFLCFAQSCCAVDVRCALFHFITQNTYTNTQISTGTG